MKRDMDDTSVEVGSGNVFADIGVSDPELELAKAKIVLRIADIIRARGWTQAEAAKVMGVDQPKVSLVVRGRSDYTLERLMSFLKRLGQGITINFDATVGLVEGGRISTAVARKRESIGFIKVVGAASPVVFAGGRAKKKDKNVGAPRAAKATR
jgi:predicted XRE-type DNA-binding protein